MCICRLGFQPLATPSIISRAIYWRLFANIWLTASVGNLEANTEGLYVFWLGLAQLQVGAAATLYYSLFETVTTTPISVLLAASTSSNSHKETLTDADWKLNLNKSDQTKSYVLTNDRRVIITKVDDNEESELIAGTSEELYNSWGAAVSGWGS